MFDNADINELNSNIEGWNNKTKNAVLSKMDDLGIKHSKNSPNKTPLRKAFTSSVGKKFDIINKISYKMPRSAVFLHKGVSRSHPISNPRQAKQWFNPVIDNNIGELGDIVANGQGNLIVNALQIK
jgi:hypothetical protein